MDAFADLLDLIGLEFPLSSKFVNPEIICESGLIAGN